MKYSNKRSSQISTGFVGNMLVLVLLLALASSCITISTFDQYAYVQGTSLKVESLALMDKAVDSVQIYADAIEQLELKLQKAYEYEKGRPKNEVSTQMWQILISPDRKLLGGFLARWRANKVLGKAFVTETKGIIGDAFDLITGLESQKLKEEDAKSTFLGRFAN